jgi:catechol 2,3-dioxygenase-like lactoylglutathione lyase family enzyme
MKLNHLNLTVTHPLETQEFLVKYFGMQPMGKGNSRMAFVTDENGMVLSMFHAGDGVDIVYPDAFHVGFIQESPAKVDEMHQRLKDDGFDVPAPSRMHGSWTFYFKAPGGFTIEVLS